MCKIDPVFKGDGSSLPPPPNDIEHPPYLGTVQRKHTDPAWAPTEYIEAQFIFNENYAIKLQNGNVDFFPW